MFLWLTVWEFCFIFSRWQDDLQNGRVRLKSRFHMKKIHQISEQRNTTQNMTPKREKRTSRDFLSGLSMTQAIQVRRISQIQRVDNEGEKLASIPQCFKVSLPRWNASEMEIRDCFRHLEKCLIDPDDSGCEEGRDIQRVFKKGKCYQNIYRVLLQPPDLVPLYYQQTTES